jgi:hypothetical protein
MEKVPFELWGQIFSLACTDDGFTGRSLAAVSIYIRHASAQYRLQSVAVIGIHRMIAFASYLERLPSDFQKVRHLLIAEDSDSVTPAESMYDVFVSRASMLLGAQNGGDVYEQFPEHTVMHTVFPLILTKLAPTLECLYVVLKDRFIRIPVALPHLTELTLCATFLKDTEAGSLISGVCPSLRRLHFKAFVSLPPVSNLLHQIPEIAPSLTHLRISSPFSYSVWEAVEKFLKQTSDRNEMGKHTRTIQQILIQKGQPPPCGRGWRTYADLQAKLNALERADGRVFAMESSRHEARTSMLDEINTEWRDRIAGGNGCWMDYDISVRG